ncbi:MAG: hypothetical protein V5A64_06550 [Candidatus Thermoplasmatota archaeon]
MKRVKDMERKQQKAVFANIHNSGTEYRSRDKYESKHTPAGKNKDNDLRTSWRTKRMKEKKEKKITFNTNNNFGFLKFIEEDDEAEKIKQRAEEVFKDGRYYKLPKKLEQTGRKKGWIRWEGEKAIKGYEDELEKIREEREELPLSGKTTSIEFDREIFLEYLRKAEKKVEKEETISKQKEEEKEEKERRLFEIAKKTGEKQKIESFPVPCRDSREECNLDIVTSYAMPDGKRKEEINHTW